MLTQERSHHDVILVRHGYSAGNAGKRTFGVTEIPLEDRGHAEAQVIADCIVDTYGADRISHIVTTPYLRTRQTAAPLVARTGLTPLVHPNWREITYLQPSRADGTIYEERAAMRDVFWAATRLNPGYTDAGEHDVDSANSFLRRIRSSLGELALLTREDDGVIVVFAHEYPISTAVNIAQGKTDEAIIADMVAHQKPSPRIDNTQATGLTLTAGELTIAHDSDFDLFPDSRLAVN